MSRSWDATGRLKPLWGAVGGRDELAAKAGISPPSTLSAYNSGGRPLGLKNARKLAAALGVTIYDLGAPTEAAPEEAQTILSSLEEIRRLLLQLQGLVQPGPALIVDQLEEIVTRLEQEPAALSSNGHAEAEAQLRRLAGAILTVAEAIAARRAAQGDAP